MPFVPLYERLPVIARRETRSVIVSPESNLPVPPDEYGFVELFCDEPGCDCRRVMFTVFSRKRNRQEAVIAWGWESRKFYAKWLHDIDRQMGELLIGPCLNIGSPASEIADGLVEVVRRILLTDKSYTDRVKRHYTMFRQTVEAKGDRRRKR